MIALILRSTTKAHEKTEKHLTQNAQARNPAAKIRNLYSYRQPRLKL
jgi:hypothetical protein